MELIEIAEASWPAVALSGTSRDLGVSTGTGMV